jgi:hypothetical protein
MFIFMIGTEMKKLWTGNVDLLGCPTRLTLMEGQYDNGRTAIVAIVGGEPYGTLTVNMPEVEQGDGEIFVKTWSENEHWAGQLLKAVPELFTDTGQRIAASYVQASVWRFTRPREE